MDTIRLYWARAARIEATVRQRIGSYLAAKGAVFGDTGWHGA